MSSFDLWTRDVITYYGSALLLLTVSMWILSRYWERCKMNLYRSHLLGFEADVADLAASRKKRLFEDLTKIESRDEILRSLGKIRLLEIGVKTGENIQFYPDGTYFIGVDWNKRLRDYLTGSERSWQFDHVYFERLVIGDGSSLKAIPSGCVDAVVTTRSLCSTRSLRQTLREIKRVLAPVILIGINISDKYRFAQNGKYFFMEHVLEPENTLVHWCQKFLTRTGIWPSLYGDCRLDVNPIEAIESAGFSELMWKSFILKGYVSQPYHLFLTRKHVVGTATR